MLSTKVLKKEYKRLKKTGLDDLSIYFELKKIDDKLTITKFYNKIKV